MYSTIIGKERKSEKQYLVLYEPCDFDLQSFHLLFWLGMSLRATFSVATASPRRSQNPPGRDIDPCLIL